MTLSDNVVDREFQKFEEDSVGKERIKTKVKIEGGAG